MDLLPNVEESNLEEEIIDVPIEDSIEDSEEIEDMPEIKEKEKIQVEEVFKKAELLETAPIIKKVKRTRTMTPAAKEKLAQARVKAIETRKRNAELRKEGKMKKPSEIKEDKIKQEEEKKKPVINNITNNITHEDIEKISLAATQKALDGYEQVRKERKALKLKKKEEDNQRTIIKKKIETAMGMGHPNFFDHCF